MSSSAGANKRRNAKVLNDLAKHGLEPSDLAVGEKYDEFKLDVTRQALKVLKEVIPAKILYFNELVRVNANPGDVLHTRDLENCVFPKRPTKRPRVESETALTEFKADINTPIQQTQISCVTTSEAFPDHFPLCSQVLEMGAKVRCDALELIEMVGVVRLWIQLNVPRIEDGNNFGVAIQEEAIQELGKVEDAAFNLCDGIKYHMTRAKLISKKIKYPTIEDYVQSIIEVDRKEWIHLKVSLVDMRNSYCMLYDLLHKNWEKVVKPRTADGGSYMVM